MTIQYCSCENPQRGHALAPPLGWSCRRCDLPVKAWVWKVEPPREKPRNRGAWDEADTSASAQGPGHDPTDRTVSPGTEVSAALGSIEDIVLAEPTLDRDQTMVLFRARALATAAALNEIARRKLFPESQPLDLQGVMKQALVDAGMLPLPQRIDGKPAYMAPEQAAASDEACKARVRGYFSGPLPSGLLRPLRPGEGIELPPDPRRVHRPLFADVDFKTGPVPPLEHPGEMVIGLGPADETGRSEVVVMFSDANGSYVIDRGQVPLGLLGLGREVVLKAKLPERPLPAIRTFAGLVSLVDPPDPEKLAAKARAQGINPEKLESALWLALDRSEEAEKRARAAEDARQKAVRSRDQTGTKLGQARIELAQVKALLFGAQREARENGNSLTLLLAWGVREIEARGVPVNPEDDGHTRWMLEQKGQIALAEFRAERATAQRTADALELFRAWGRRAAGLPADAEDADIRTALAKMLRESRRAAEENTALHEVGQRNLADELEWLRNQAADIDPDLPLAELEPAQLRGVIGVELLRLRRELAEARSEVETGNARAGELVAERAALRRELGVSHKDRERLQRAKVEAKAAADMRADGEPNPEPPILARMDWAAEQLVDSDPIGRVLREGAASFRATLAHLGQARRELDLGVLPIAAEAARISILKLDMGQALSGSDPDAAMLSFEAVRAGARKEPHGQSQ